MHKINSIILVHKPSFNYTYISPNGNAYGNIFELFETGFDSDESLSKIIHIISKPIAAADTSYVNLIKGDIDFDYKDGIKDNVHQINLNFRGELFKANVVNDTLAYYDMQFKIFSIDYDNGSRFLIIKNGLPFIHEYAKLLFLKRNKKLYTIFIYEPIISSSKKDTTLTLLNL